MPITLKKLGPAAPVARVAAGDGAPGGVELRAARHRHGQGGLHEGLLLGHADLHAVLAQQRGEAGNAVQRVGMTHGAEQ